MAKTEAAIAALRSGQMDHPDLVAVGPMTDNEDRDIRKIQRFYLTEEPVCQRCRKNTNHIGFNGCFGDCPRGYEPCF